ncbi:MAG: response regulator transcription factor [Oscillospiraceae bacterium]|nr:response regulator transcription factor [Oscillospiraceae bacterium]
MNNKYKILLVEDEKNIQTFVSALLEANGYKVLIANDCASGKIMYSSHIPDLVILDLGLPDRDGSVLLAYIRQNDLTPIIVLSARSDENEKVKMLDAGANDYVTKPFGTAELLARVRACLRNRRQSSSKTGALTGIFTAKDLEIRYESRRVFIRGEEIKLTQTEYNILTYLSENADKVMTYSAIISAVWRETPNEGNIKRLQVNMANMRKKFGTKPGDITFIINELGVGYRLVADN